MSDEKTVWLTAKQVAERYNIPVATIYSWANRAKIRSHKIFGVLRFISEEVVEDLERRFGIG